MKPKGPSDAAAAAFVFKTSQDRAGDAWQQLAEVDRSDREANGALNRRNADGLEPSRPAVTALRREHHEVAGALLIALTEWNSVRRQFLMIVAHGVGRPTIGLSPTDVNAGELVRWEQLASALPNGVDYLFLVGCETTGACQALDATSGPVRRAVISTTSSKEWGHLLEAFAEVIAMAGSRFTFDDELRKVLAQKFDAEVDVRWAVDGAWSSTCPPADPNMALPDLDYDMLSEDSEAS